MFLKFCFKTARIPYIIYCYKFEICTIICYTYAVWYIPESFESLITESQFDCNNSVRLAARISEPPLLPPPPPPPAFSSSLVANLSRRACSSVCLCCSAGAFPSRGRARVSNGGAGVLHQQPRSPAGDADT